MDTTINVAAITAGMGDEQVAGGGPDVRIPHDEFERRLFLDHIRGALAAWRANADGAIVRDADVTGEMAPDGSFGLVVSRRDEGPLGPRPSAPAVVGRVWLADDAGRPVVLWAIEADPETGTLAQANTGDCPPVLGWELAR